MSILGITTAQPAGLTSVNPQIIYILTNNTFAEVTATGYLTNAKQEGFTFNEQQMALVYTTDEGPVWLKVDITYNNASVLSAVVSLVQISSPGDVILPTIANHLMVSTDAAGTLANLTGTAINDGPIQAGRSSISGYLASFPSAASKGSLRLTAVANTGDTLTTISNVAMGQASIVSIPDPANAVGRFLVGAAATPFVSGNFPVASGTGGLMVDSGVAASALAQTANVILKTPAGLQTITVGGLTVAAGNVTAGASAVPASFISFPTTAANGTLILAAADAGAAFNTTISNGTMGQSCVYTIPDVAAATGQFLAKTAALVNGNLVQASGTAGVCVDSGVATSNVQLKTQVLAVRSADIGGGGATVVVANASVTANSVVVANIVSSTNTVSIAKVTPGAGDITFLFDADPGAACVLNYIVFIAQQ